MAWQTEEGSLDNLEEIVRVNHAVFEGLYQWEPYTLQQYEERLSDKHPLVYIAKDDGQIVGNSIAFNEDGKLYLWILAVEAEHRNQGIGTKLLQLNENYAKACRYSGVSVKVYRVSEEMRQLLEKRGYKGEEKQRHEFSEFDSFEYQSVFQSE